ncbi:type II toxin-antitoxin system PemK/MazF family toxin [Liquorilactobacillus ghanensis]|uniref:type II toxin-antitoxin system PemK/MazF family toxin n=1 Tax=Liquorilactobacillus ghanensis TaxID=399370 RepID=UPI0039E7CED1
MATIQQGDIIKIAFDGTKGHEQSGWRPAIVVSNDAFNNMSRMAKVLPITHTNNGFPLHVKLPSGLETDGFVLLEHERTFDLNAREWKLVEKCPSSFIRQIRQMSLETY